MGRIRLTAKRQATFPAALCEEMRVGPGDTLEVEKAIVDGQAVWLLRPTALPEECWFGALRKYARGRALDMDSVRKSIEDARRDGRI